MLNGVIFDMDGVIINSHPIHRRAWKRFLDTLGVNVTAEELEFVTQGGKREDILRHFLGPLSDEQVVEYGHRKEEAFREEALEIDPMPGLSRFLDQLEKAKLAVGLASCGSSVRIRYVLERLNWTGRFKVIVTGDDVKRGKPDPTIFRKAASDMGVVCGEALVFEDAAPGVKAAVSAGMKAIGVASNGGTKLLLAAGASRVVPDFSSITLIDVSQLFETSLPGASGS